MSVVRRPIFTGAALPDTSENVYPEPFSVKATNDLVDATVLIFEDSGTDILIALGFFIPKEYTTDAAPKIGGTAQCTATSGDYIMKMEMRAIALGEDGDPSTFQETEEVTTTVPGTALQDQEFFGTFTAANFAADDRVILNLIRKGSDSLDTLAASLIVRPETLFFEFDDGN